MRRLFSFLSGLVIGAVLVYFAMSYHVIHSKDGLHLIPKINGELAATYVDIREFQVADWAQNAQVAAALVQAGRRDLIDNAINETVNQGIERLLNRNIR